MALGDTYNNNEKKNYSPTVHSAYSFSNIESNIDKTKLYTSYWNKLLIVAIAPKKDTTGDNVAFDYENEGKIYLSHTKACILYKEISMFLKEYAENGSVSFIAGVNTGKDGLIYLCDGREFNAEGPCLVIRKVDETGHPTSTFVYEFRRNVHSSITKYNAETTDFESRFYDVLEIEQFANLLKSYYESMTMAVAYSVQEARKYDTSRINTKLKVIGEKLGVDFNGNNNNRSSNSSYFSNARPQQQSTGYNGPSNSYESGSLDDLD